jgi:hypothetical protein
MAEDFANGAHPECTSTPIGDIVQIAGQTRAMLDAGPEASIVPDGWSSYAENGAIVGFDGLRYTIDSPDADVWLGTNRFGTLYQRGAMRDGVSVTAHLASIVSKAIGRGPASGSSPGRTSSMPRPRVT